MIRAKDLTRRYGDFSAVDNVSFSVGRGEIVGLLGHNGAGKTTVMKMLTGVLEPTGGQIYVDELAMGISTKQIQRRVGYLPENAPAWPEMSVIDFLDFKAGLQGIAEIDRSAAVVNAIRQTSLQEKATASIQTLSRGYCQRVGVAQAILHEPDIVILDEPTNGLDPTQIRQMRDLINDLSRKATVILSTHILQEVQAVCERVLIMRSGELVVDSSIAELQKDGAIMVSVAGDAINILSAIEGVAQVDDLGATSDRRRYRLHAKHVIAPKIATAVINAGLPLYEIAVERQNLESVFAEINGDPAHV